MVTIARRRNFSTWSEWSYTSCSRPVDTVEQNSDRPFAELYGAFRRKRRYPTWPYCERRAPFLGRWESVILRSARLWTARRTDDLLAAGAARPRRQTDVEATSGWRSYPESGGGTKPAKRWKTPTTETGCGRFVGAPSTVSGCRTTSNWWRSPSRLDRPRWRARGPPSPRSRWTAAVAEAAVGWLTPRTAVEAAAGRPAGSRWWCGTSA